MKVIAVGFENGSSNNSNLYQISRELWRMKLLHKLICISCKDDVEIPTNLLIKEPLLFRGLNYLMSKVKQDIIEVFPDRYYAEQLLFDYFAQKHICKDADLVIHTDSGLLRSLRKAKSQGVPTIILHRTLHPRHISDILRLESEKYGVKEKSVFVRDKWNANRIKTLEECEKIFALSRLEVDSLRHYGIEESKIELIHHGQGVDTEYFKPPKEKGGTFTVLFLGHKSLIKGVPYLLEAWKKLNLKNARLIVAGHQDKKLIEIYRRKILFEAPGSVNPLKYYQQSHIYVLPSLGEPFPRTVLEAMSCGLPVIISDMVGAKDVIEEGKEGFIIPARNIQAIAEKIKYFYDNPSEIERMGRNARKKAEEYTWENFAQEVTRKIIDF